jgi:hypothetical protein
MAISGDARPGYTHIAKFVPELGPQIGALFTQVQLTCDRLGLIGRTLFAIDGVKLAGASPPSSRRLRTSATTRAHAALHAARQGQGRHAAAAVLPGAQHREDCDQGDASGLRGRWPRRAQRRAGKRALTPQAASRFNADPSTRGAQPMNSQRLQTRFDAVLRFKNRVKAQSR